MSRTFDDALELARVYERRVAAWFASRGWLHLPVYDYSGLGEGKAPKLIGAKRALVTPDLLIARSGETAWVEVKWKARADFTRVTNRYETGIDLRLWEHYIQVEAVTGLPVWLVFVQQSEGFLCGRKVLDLRPLARFSRNFNCGRGGMFFGLDDLRHLVDLVDLPEAA